MGGYNRETQLAYYRANAAEIAAKRRAEYHAFREEAARAAGYGTLAEMQAAEQGRYARKLAQIPVLRQQGLSLAAIGSRLHISGKTVAKLLHESGLTRRNAGHCEKCKAQRDCMASVRAGGPMLMPECGDEPLMFWSREEPTQSIDAQVASRDFADEYAGPHGRITWGRR